MRRPSPMRLAALALIALVAREAFADASGGREDGPRLGFLLRPADTAGLPPVQGEATGWLPLVRIEARWERVESVPGAYDWTEFAPAIDALESAGYRAVLALGGSHPHHLPQGGPPSPLDGGSLEAWLDFVRSAARTFSGRVVAFELGVGPPGGSGADADIRALVLKQSTLAVRAELGARGAQALIVQGAIPAGALDWQRLLWERDVAAYVDVLPIVCEAAVDLDPPGERVQAMFEASLRHPPAPELWVYAGAEAGWDGAALAVGALTTGASVALFQPSTHEEIAWANGLQRTLDAGYGPAARGALRLVYDEGPQPTAARVFGRFFNERDFSTLVVYHAPGAGEPAGLVVDSGTARNVRLLDPVTGDTRRARTTEVEGHSGRVVRLETAPAPAGLLYQSQLVTPGFETPAEDLEVASERGLTAEEVIARFQQLQRDQDDRLERWTARGRIDFHFKLGQSASTVDVSIDSNYFWERGGQLEWEQTSYFINGNRVRWKNIPELPLIQPEKVITLPLDLTLDRTYAYRHAGEERVGGREAYVIAFEPVAPDPTRSLYRGRVWIDKQTFARLKASVIQNNLEAPVLSNEETDRFQELPGPDGHAYWMLASIDGQQVWNAAGRTFVVERELTFGEFEINPRPAEFEQRRQAAYASQNQMLRDTDEGFRYLERQADGSRVVKQEQDTSQLFAAAGAFKDGSYDNVVPLAGVNYFDYDLWGKNIQVNALFAGVLGLFTASKPSLGGTRNDLTVDAGLNALKSENQVYEGNDEVEAEAVEERNQTLALRLGLPAGQFVKFNLIAGLALRQYFDSDDGDAAIEAYNEANGANLGFVLPQDHVELTGTAEVEFNRRGYNVSAAVARSRRSDWAAWGLMDMDRGGDFGAIVDGVFVADGGEPVQDDFTRWRLFAGKEWHLAKFQKIRAAVNWLDGSDLDRFSRYEFSFLGDDRLNGFSGTGVRFDEGLIGRLGYAFNLFEVVRFDAALESARVEQVGTGVGSQSFSGAGLSANFVGPWKTVINVNYGYALASDIPDLEGQQEFLALVLKLF